jgi:hypothetical protein
MVPTTSWPAKRCGNIAAWCLANTEVMSDLLGLVGWAGAGVAVGGAVGTGRGDEGEDQACRVEMRRSGIWIVGMGAVRAATRRGGVGCRRRPGLGGAAKAWVVVRDGQAGAVRSRPGLSETVRRAWAGEWSGGGYRAGTARRGQSDRAGLGRGWARTGCVEWGWVVGASGWDRRDWGGHGEGSRDGQAGAVRSRPGVVGWAGEGSGAQGGVGLGRHQRPVSEFHIAASWLSSKWSATFVLTLRAMAFRKAAVIRLSRARAS